tara:strand:+ start:4203 stop:5498 length:1296 start_codon:yes stop_codon:yes gene_type:complete
MTIYTGFDVSIGGFAPGSGTVTAQGVPTAAVDFTSRVRALKVDQSIKIGAIGRSEIKVILDNTDGALTPGGGGTYADWDWFAQPLFILARAGLSDPPALYSLPYSGPIVSFDFVDDGFDSFVTLTAVDWMTFVGRWSVQTGQTVTSSSFTALKTLALTVQLATYNSLNVDVFAPYSPDALPVDVSVTTLQGQFLGDTFETIAATEGGIIYPGWIEFSPSRLIYYIWGTQRALLAPLTTASLLPDFNGTGTVGSTELPMRALELGFNDHELITQAEVSRTGGTAQFSYKDTASQTYGPRSVSLTNLPLVTDADALSHAEELTTRYDTTDFVPSSFEFTGSMVEGANDAALDGVKTLLSASAYNTGPLFKPTTITWTGAGSTSNTATVTPMRLRLSATPEDWTMRLHTLDAGSNMGFILDDTRLGVLDQNRIT